MDTRDYFVDMELSVVPASIDANGACVRVALQTSWQRVLRCG